MNEEKMNKKLKLTIPIETIEQSAQQQIYDILKLKELKKLAIMPDVHAGYTLPIGGVALLDNVISPSMVGYDIGCGMCMVNTKVPFDEMFKNQKDKEKLYNNIYKTIPVGFTIHTDSQEYHEFRSMLNEKELDKKINDKIFKSIGTLGGGNHFIEIGKNKNGYVCITIHSGSRNPGHSVAEWYMKKFPLLLDIMSDEGKAYIHDMNFMLDFALENRKRMMISILKLMGFSKKEIHSLLKGMINKTHNHAEIREDGVLHRKGATSSYKDELGVIPGNMRDGVYVVKGLGNEEFLSSSSHGAGRVMSRNQAKKIFSVDKFKKEMNGKIAKVEQSTLDESPFAYKNIHEVISYQDGVLVDVIDKITSEINIKG